LAIVPAVITIKGGKILRNVTFTMTLSDSQPDSQPDSHCAIVVGAGIGGLTAAALLAKRGYAVTVYDQAIVPGGCASTFQRKGFTFDVGATQVAGLEPGGIHYRIFEELGLELPAATPCDPACAVVLPGEVDPINVWRDLDRWKAERQRQFPGSEGFWNLLSTLFEASWEFQARDPVLPPRNGWDLVQLVGAMRPNTLITAPFTFSTVGDALRWFGLDGDRRLKTFLDMQLKLYSQVLTDETALLYAATAMAMSQLPFGLWHLEGSMQVLSDRLVSAIERNGGKIHMRHTVEAIHLIEGKATSVQVRSPKNEVFEATADHIVANVTVQDLVRLLGDDAPSGYRKRVAGLNAPSGAFVIYMGVQQSAIPKDCPPHLQFLYDEKGPVGENNSLFVSVSKPGDGRAPEGMATIVASSFVDAEPWWAVKDDPMAYTELKQSFTETAIARLSSYFDLEGSIVYQEAGTPLTFWRYTAREKGYVGGVGMRVSTFGPFGFATRSPIENLWLVGDSTHPGEGTAGVSYSALTVVRQIEEKIRKMNGK
jgi:C-3',4' desaturase CrtD